MDVGSSISTREVNDGPEGRCGLGWDESGGDAPDSRGCSTDAGRLHVLLTRGKDEPLTTYLLLVVE